LKGADIECEGRDGRSGQGAEKFAKKGRTGEMMMITVEESQRKRRVASTFLSELTLKATMPSLLGLSFF
jgi:hypothetical protein